MSAINFLVLLYTDCFDTYRPVIKMAYGGFITPPNNHTLHILNIACVCGGGGGGVENNGASHRLRFVIFTRFRYRSCLHHQK